MISRFSSITQSYVLKQFLLKISSVTPVIMLKPPVEQNKTVKRQKGFQWFLSLKEILKFYV